MQYAGHGTIEAALKVGMRGCEPERSGQLPQKSEKEIENLVFGGRLELGKNIEYSDCVSLAKEYKEKADNEQSLIKKAIYRRVEAGLYLVTNDIEKAIEAYDDVINTYILEARQVVGKEGAEEKALAERLSTYIGDYSTLVSDLEEDLRQQ